MPCCRLPSVSWLPRKSGQDFHSRWQSQGKTYRYRIYRGRVLPPFEYGRVLHYPWPLDHAAMAAAARQFEGEHDFSSFAASSGSEDDDRDRDMQRVIYSSEIFREQDRDEIAYVVRGKSFLRYMVRKIVGTLLEVGRGRLFVRRYSGAVRGPRPLPLRPHGAARRPLPGGPGIS